MQAYTEEKKNIGLIDKLPDSDWGSQNEIKHLKEFYIYTFYKIILQWKNERKSGMNIQ